MLDVFSLRVAFAVLALTLLVLFYLVTFRSSRSGYSAWWCLAIISFLVGSFAFVLDGTWHQRWANPAGDALLVLGASCVWGAARSLRLMEVKGWQVAAAPAATAVLSALDPPAVNTGSGGPCFLTLMALMAGLASRELWRAKGGYGGAEATMAVISGMLAVFYFCRCGTLVLEGPHGSVFRAFFGTEITTLLTMAFLIVVSSSFSALSAEQATQELRFRASHDGLTGLLNRTAFLALLEDALGHRRGVERSGALILADLDHFKAINDRSGHAGGDAALKVFASACTSSVRSNDLVGRYGGEEFVLFLPGATTGQALRVTEQINVTMKESDQSRYPAPTASYGIARLEAGSGSVAAALKSADAALYRAKAQGRNQAVLAVATEL